MLNNFIAFLLRGDKFYGENTVRYGRLETLQGTFKFSVMIKIGFI